MSTNADARYLFSVANLFLFFHSCIEVRTTSSLHATALTLKYRRIRGDMIEVYKIVTNKYDSGVNF